MKRSVKKIISFLLVIMMSMTMFVPVLADGEISVYLDNEKIQFDVAPLLVDGRTMVPLRAIFEKLGATVYWDSNTRTAIAQKGNTTVSIAIDDTRLYKNGTPIILDVPAQLNSGRTLVPLRAVSEAFECDVQWIGDTRTINIYSNDTFNPSSIDLSNAVIGVYSGTLAESYVSMDYGETNAVIKKYDDHNALLEALNQGVLDCAIFDKETSKILAEKNDNFVMLDQEYVIDEYTIYTSKEDKQLTEQLNTAIQKLKDNGVLQQIIDDGLNGKFTYVSKGNNYSNGVLTVATSPDFPPFEFEENGNFKGIDIDIITAIADILNYKLEIKAMKFDELLSSISAGKVNAVISGMTLTDERLELFDCTTPYMTNSLGILVNKNANILSGEIIQIEPPKNIRVVGQQNGSAYIQWDEVEGAEYYHFYYQEDGEDTYWFDEDDNGEKLKFEHGDDYSVLYDGLENGKRYNIIATSIKDGVESQDSEIFTFVATTTSLKEEAVDKLRNWVYNNSNYDLEGHKLYEYKLGNYKLSITPNIDEKNLSIGYIEFKNEETTSVSVNLLTTRFMGSYSDDINDTFNVSAGDIVKSSVSNSLELTCDYYEGDYTGNKNKLIDKYQDSVSITLKLFDNFLNANYVGLTLKDFELNFDLSSVVLNNNQTDTVVPTPSYPQNNIPNNSYQGDASYSINTKITFSSFPLYLYADDGTGTFLGNINSNQFDTDSIANQFGKYGSEFQTKSIFNEFGTCGSQFSQYSPFNEFASNPPKILDKNGKVVGYLTANKYITDAISYEEMMVLLKKLNK